MTTAVEQEQQAVDEKGPISLADCANRRRDRRKVERRLRLEEHGEADRVLRCVGGGDVLAVGYSRVVYGDAGAYVEVARHDFAPGVIEDSFELRTQGRYYDLWKSKALKNVELYAQTRTVEDRPNPPAGRDAVRRGRTGQGYADYRVGFWYVSVKLLSVDGREMAAKVHQRPALRNGKEVGRGKAMLLDAATAAAAGGGGCFDLVPVEGVISRWLAADGRRKCFRFRRLAPRDMATATGLSAASCVSVKAWRNTEDSTLVAITIVSGSSEEGADARLLGPDLSATVRRASTSDVERACAWPRAYDALPVAPRPPPGTRVFVDAALLTLEVINLHVPRGFIAKVSPQQLLTVLGPDATVVPRPSSGEAPPP